MNAAGTDVMRKGQVIRSLKCPALWKEKNPIPTTRRFKMRAVLDICIGAKEKKDKTAK